MAIQIRLIFSFSVLLLLFFVKGAVSHLAVVFSFFLKSSLICYILSQNCTVGEDAAFDVMIYFNLTFLRKTTFFAARY